jgi:hypothetical protein
MKPLVVLVAATAALLQGCQTWGPTWSEVTGQQWNYATMFKRPLLISRVDGVSTTPPEPYKVTPGKHDVEVQGLTPARAGVIVFKNTTIDFEPCKRYYLNGQYPNTIDNEFTIVIDYVETIAGCQVTPPAK